MTESFYESMHIDQHVRKYLYDAGNDFMGGEVNETVSIHEIHILIKTIWKEAEDYARNGTLPNTRHISEIVHHD
jgi:hypothetical protein